MLTPQPTLRPVPKIFVFGGVGDNAYYNDVWVLDIQLAQWTQIETTGASPKARFSHTACLIGTAVLIYGGYTTLILSYQLSHNRIFHSLD